MKPEQVFKIANAVIFPPWLLMLLLPKSDFTSQVINSNVFPIALGFLYVYYVAKSFGKVKANFSTLDGVAKMFTNKEALLAGWVHYLVFDLFVGSWQWQDAISNGYPHWILIVSLPFTLMLGPFGLLLYFGLRYFVM